MQSRPLPSYVDYNRSNSRQLYDDVRAPLPHSHLSMRRRISQVRLGLGFGVSMPGFKLLASPLISPMIFPYMIPLYGFRVHSTLRDYVLFKVQGGSPSEPIHELCSADLGDSKGEWMWHQ